MGIGLIFKIAAVGILVTILSQVLKHSGREEHAFLVSLAGLILFSSLCGLRNRHQTNNNSISRPLMAPSPTESLHFCVISRCCISAVCSSPCLDNSILFICIVSSA